MRTLNNNSSLLLTLAATLVVLLWSRPSAAQRAARSTRVPAPADQTLTTKDGVVLGFTYYAGIEGKNTTPVILLHDYNESRAVFDDFARVLQDPTSAGVADAKTRAVIAVDLRGHGASTTAVNTDGTSSKLDAKRFGTADFEDMVLFDLETIRQFLISENDAQKLNINKLCVVGTGMGANVAVSWTAADWNMPPLAVRKQGQDIKGLVLVSPQWNFHGLSLAGPLRQPDVQREVSVLLAYGSESRAAASDAKNILDILRPFHPDPPRDREAELKDLYEMPFDTSLQGTELLLQKQFELGPSIDLFIERRLDSKPFAWTKRLLD